MGRIKSTHVGQSTSFLIATIAMSHPSREFEAMMVSDVIPEPLAQWAQKRRTESEIEQMIHMLLLVFQDDMLELLVGFSSRSIIERVEKSVMQQKIGIALSPKPESNRPFSTTFVFIGVKSERTDPQHIRRRRGRHL